MTKLHEELSKVLCCLDMINLDDIIHLLKGKADLYTISNVEKLSTALTEFEDKISSTMLKDKDLTPIEIYTWDMCRKDKAIET